MQSCLKTPSTVFQKRLQLALPRNLCDEALLCVKLKNNSHFTIKLSQRSKRSKSSSLANQSISSHLVIQMLLTDDNGMYET